MLTPGNRRRGVRCTGVQRIEQLQDRVIVDPSEPLPGLGGHPGARQVLEELLWFPGTARRAQRFHQQRAAAALGGEHQIRSHSAGHPMSLAAVFVDAAVGGDR
ncbi:Uncharacterised protein [Mycobacterium tuberculosis]|uniref:Uncharacterized protein n=1 Tax=Mycobacterium tuberculosis TaxID=1773 RepID=A0A654U8B7_MYCTX|nr:Uncharacterised protein [Mycobacterium tuberculosis]